MRRIINPWIHTEGYNCFGCSPSNPLGVHMHFYEEDPDDLKGDIISVWQPNQAYQSWINTLHGGIQATLLDEICGWIVFRKLLTSGMTAKMEIRYRQPVSTVDGPLLLKARLKTANHRLAVVEAELCNLQGDILSQCECTYFTFSDSKAQEMGYTKATIAEEDLTLEEIIEREAHSDGHNDNKQTTTI